MPQLVKGGKYIFGWSHVSDTGSICIPEEAREEYNFRSFDKIFIMSGSKTSKGFSITKKDLIKNCVIYNKLSNYRELINFQELPNGYLKDKDKIYTWSEVDADGYFKVSEEVLKQYDVKLKENVLVGRGSGFALAFIKTGSIIKEAIKHSELIVYR
jgi:bifunctional DNA-binding transcriptional regulator/antitoxin component of YhaV-PrlF toxin-antitoxin module